MKPIVYLIGTGPGHPDLIAARGLRCLANADVVIYDHHVHPRLLRHAREGAEKIDVGLAGPRPLAQEAICYLLAEKVREGHRVARLKWGAPSMLDGGGVEALFLHEQRVAFEVVPAVSPGIAAAVYTGIPLTHPAGGGTVTFVDGAGDASGKPVDWQHLARLDGTIVCHGTAEALPAMLESLLTPGRSGDDAAAIVYDPAQPTQTTQSGSLEEMSRIASQSAERRAGFALIGRGAALRDHLRWFDTRPLFGRRVLVTRPREQARELVERLQALGADTVEAPMIRITPPDAPAPLLQAAEDPSAFDWIVFTSANSVEGFMTALLSQHRDVRALKGPRLCAVGPGTAERLRHYSVVADAVPAEYRAEAVLGTLAAHGSLTGVRVLLPRSDIGREVIAEQLRISGARVTDVIAYRTVLDELQREGDPDVYGMLLEGRIDVVTFTSASAVRNFARVNGADQVADLLKATTVAVIGPVTADAARQAGITVSVEPSSYTIGGLVDAIATHYSKAAVARSSQ